MYENEPKTAHNVQPHRCARSMRPLEETGAAAHTLALSRLIAREFVCSAAQWRIAAREGT